MSRQVARQAYDVRPPWVDKWLARDEISPSDIIKLTEDCSREFFFRRQKTDGIDVDDRPRLLGRHLHDMIAKYFLRVPDRPSKATIASIGKTVYETYFDEKRFASIKRRAERCWKNFVKFEQGRLKTWKSYRPTIVEGRIKAAGYSTIVDFYSEKDEKGLDWKSGAMMGIDTAELIQGKTYTVVLNAIGSRCKDFSFVSLMTGREFPLPRVTKGWLDQKRARARSIVRLGEFPPKPSGRCKHCTYILACQLWKRCLWI